MGHMLKCKKCGWQFWVDSQEDVDQHEKNCVPDQEQNVIHHQRITIPQSEPSWLSKNKR